MQQFDDNMGVRRRFFDFVNMKAKDVKEYYEQKQELEPEVRVKKMKALTKRIKELKKQKDVTEWVLAICSKEGKIIGLIEVSFEDEDTASLKIDIPDEMHVYKFGIKAIDQFKKMCYENDLFKFIQLDSECRISNRYIEAHELVDYKIKVEVA